MLPSPITGGDRRAGGTAFLPFPHRHYNHPSSPSPSTRTMEEVWKDITLSCLHDAVPGTPSVRHRPAGAGVSPSFRSIILQDFLNHPATAAPPSPPPATVLSLNSGPDFYFPGHHHGGDSPLRHQLIDVDDGGGSSRCDIAAFDALASSVLASFGKKRFSDGGGGGGGDRRHKRMIKNRESAARSRARKQAYITQLESEVDRLNEENAMLREKQQKQMQQTQPAHQLPKKHHALQRTTTF